MGIVCARIVLVFDISVVFLWDFHWKNFRLSSIGACSLTVSKF